MQHGHSLLRHDTRTGLAVEPFDHRVVDVSPRRDFKDHSLSDEETSDWVDRKLHRKPPCMGVTRPHER